MSPHYPVQFECLIKQFTISINQNNFQDEKLAAFLFQKTKPPNFWQ